MDNYEQKYKKALEKAQEAVDKGMVTQNFVNDIFPELKESEDEKIRKHLITLFKNEYGQNSNARFAGIKVKNIIAWLEKQCEHANFRNKIQIGDKVTRNRDGVLVNLSQLNRVAKIDEKQGNNADKIIERAKTEKQRVLLTETNGAANIDWDTRSLQDVKLLLEYGLDYIKKLEKQSEQKLIDKIQLGKKYKCVASPRYSAFMKGEIYKPEDKFLCSLMNFCSDYFEPIEDGEQKSTNKAEPKFHKGDWIITNKNHIWYIDETPETTSYLYRLINQYGKVEVAEFEIVDKKARLWTIEDAKDGDVLVKDIRYPFESSICLFKKLNSHIFTVKLYCSINDNGQFLHNYDAYYHRYDVTVYPATKEQRDLLFQKMREAGYEWDAEKKELKKIEQKPVECLCVPSREIIMNVWELGNIWKELTGGNISTEHGTQLEYIQKHWTEGDYFDKIEQKPAWSEEDEKISKAIIKRINGESDYLSIDLSSAIYWIKSLKDRVQSQQEWSEEDEKKINDIIEYLECYSDFDHGDEPFEGYMKRFEGYIEFMKSLQLKSQWKPDKTTLDTLQLIIYHPYSMSDYQQEILINLLEQLKKLRKE